MAGAVLATHRPDRNFRPPAANDNDVYIDGGRTALPGSVPLIVAMLATVANLGLYV